MKKKYSNIICSILIIFISLSGCKKELDLDSNTYYDIKEFLKSKNCKTDCGKQASCEGEYVRLKGVYYEDYSSCNLENCPGFRISDRNKSDYSAKYSIEVIVDTLISAEVFQLLENRNGQVIKVMGIVEGFDKNTMINCKRGFELVLNDINNIEF